MLPDSESEQEDPRGSDGFEHVFERGLNSLTAFAVPPATLAAIERSLTAQLKPVRPLPSDATLVVICVAAFTALALLLTMPFHFFGLQHLDPVQRVWMYSAVLVSALLLAVSIVEQMVPGTPNRVPPLAAAVLPLLIIGVLVSMMFRDFSMLDFTGHGIPCLRLGVLCAIPGAGFTWLLMRIGFLTDPRGAALTAGAFSGLLGVAVLALHCPFQNAAHILVWHLGVIVVTSLAGVVIGFTITGLIKAEG